MAGHQLRARSVARAVSAAARASWCNSVTKLIRAGSQRGRHPRADRGEDARQHRLSSGPPPGPGSYPTRCGHDHCILASCICVCMLASIEPDTVAVSFAIFTTGQRSLPPSSVPSPSSHEAPRDLSSRASRCQPLFSSPPEIRTELPPKEEARDVRMGEPSRGLPPGSPP